jgi:hypothetical protein
MSKKIFIDGGCSFTYGSELEQRQSSWAHQLHKCLGTTEYRSTAKPGSSNSGIARRVFQEVASHESDSIYSVAVMWSFYTRYDWAMPEHKDLDDKRWTSITPWDTTMSNTEKYKGLIGSEAERENWKRREDVMRDTGIQPFADAIYRNASNPYHEIYLSWKSIIWLQNILEKKKIPYMFTLADNSLFYDVFQPHKDKDKLMLALHDEIDFTKWFSFGERMMGFNQWASLNEYKYATTHPLDEAHSDAVKLMLPTFEKIIGGKI